MEEEAGDAEPAERRHLHVGDEERARDEVAPPDRTEVAEGAERRARHGSGGEAEEARAGGAHHAEVGEIADEGEHVRQDGPHFDLAPALEGDQRLADRVVEDGEDRPDAERMGLLAERVHLVGTSKARDRLEPLLPRAVEAALRGPELEDQVHAVSTGWPDAAEA